METLPFARNLQHHRPNFKLQIRALRASRIVHCEAKRNFELTDTRSYS